MTLALLLTAVTGAWATEFTSLKVGDVLHVGDAINTGTNYTVYGAYLDAGFQPATLVRANIGIDEITESETGAYYLIKGQNDFYFGVIKGDGYEGGYWPVTDTSDGISVTAITPGGYTELTFAVHEGSAASGPEVAWDKAKKTGTFTMPGGNVTLEPEYYPQAALTVAPTAINDVPATTDGAIVNAGTVANIGSTETAQGTVMYYVSPTALDDDALLALAADQWTADVPTAAHLAEGQAYVYYYVRGNDSDTDEENFSDGDILAANALTVTIAAEPTYAVTFADGVNPEPPAEPEWTASPNADVKKGETVTVTYTGTKKIIGVKAEKKAAAKTLAEATLEDIGKIAGKDGKIYDTKADAEAVATGNAVAMIAYVGTASDCAHGLAIALEDVNNEQLTWDNSGNNNESKTAAEWCSAWNTSKAVTGGTWRLPSISDWQYMFIGCGASESYSDNPSQMSYSGLASKLTTAQGDALPVNEDYWSSTVASPSYPWIVLFGDSYAFFGNNTWEGHAFDLVRACLAF